jgi:hypothetical protein
MRLNFPVLGGASAVIIVFWLTVFALNHFIPLCPVDAAIGLKAPFRKFDAGGMAYVAEAPSLESDGDTGAMPNQSPYLVCENRHPLGPAHTIHAEIDSKGKGRFSHWATIGFIFSTSDNSDPNTNGRSYLATRTGGQGLGGSWSGEVSQNSPPATYPVEMRLYGNVGQIAYSSSGCAGKLKFLHTDRTSYWYQEHTSYGGDKCTDGGVVEMLALDYISWNWTGSGVSATGVLRAARVTLY